MQGVNEPRKLAYCRTHHGAQPTGEYQGTWKGVYGHGDVHWYKCEVCGEVFALDSMGLFVPVPADHLEEV